MLPRDTSESPQQTFETLSSVDIERMEKELSCLEVRYLQLQHSVLQDAFVSGGRDAGAEDPLCFTQPILELLEAEREEVVLSYDALNPGGLVLWKTEWRL